MKVTIRVKHKEYLQNLDHGNFHKSSRTDSGLELPPELGPCRLLASEQEPHAPRSDNTNARHLCVFGNSLCHRAISLVNKLSARCSLRSHSGAGIDFLLQTLSNMRDLPLFSRLLISPTLFSLQYDALSKIRLANSAYLRFYPAQNFLFFMQDTKSIQAA